MVKKIAFIGKLPRKRKRYKLPTQRTPSRRKKTTYKTIHKKEKNCIKIGRYNYKEITEKEYCKLFDDKECNIYSLNDTDGEPIKFFRRVNK